MSIDPDLPPVVPDAPLTGCVWDDATRTVTCYDSEGQPVVRAYNQSENENADAMAREAADRQAQATIQQALVDAMTLLQNIIDDTNANINQNPAQRIKDLARVQRRVIRLVVRRFDGTT